MIPSWPAYYTDVPTLAFLDVFNARVLLDHSLKQYPKGAQDFAYFHEMYHIYFDTPVSGRKLSYEMSCDEGAAKELVKLGYSKTQILSFMDMLITDPTEKKKRIANIQKYLKWMRY